MTIALAATWHPRGEMPRLQRLMPTLSNVYAHIVFSLPPDAPADVVERLPTLVDWDSSTTNHMAVIINQDWNAGRYAAIRTALTAGQANHIAYADLDRLLRWVETRPEEWHSSMEAIQRHECLIIGRSQEAYRTHPQALVQTEAISNQVVSYFLGQAVDVSAGAKGFSRRAAQYLVDHTQPRRALGTDAEWTILLKRAGFPVAYIAVDGLDWESADRYQLKAADEADQRRAAAKYDADPKHWARRVEVALEIVQSALDTMDRDMIYG